MRGLIIDAHNRIIVRPFKKVFNYSERIAKGELAQVTQDLPRLIGREPLTFEQVVTELANSPAAVSAPRDSGKP